MTPQEINASITAIANLLSTRLSNRELSYWGTVLAQLGESLGTLAALEELTAQDTSDSDSGTDQSATQEAAPELGRTQGSTSLSALL